MKKKPKKIKLEDVIQKYTLDDVVESEEYKEEMEQAENEIEQHLELLQEYIGRELVEIERRAVLDIVGEYSTKDDDGYIVLYFSFIQAWKIYEHQRKKLS
jgi:hypothetical protein